MFKYKIFQLRIPHLLIFIIFSYVSSLQASVGGDGCKQRLQAPYAKLNQLERINLANQSESERLALLSASPFSSKHKSILRIATTDPELYHLSVFVLSELEQVQESPENYDIWLSFLASSNHDQLQHRIYEGLQALTLIHSTGALVAFEPRGGFFPSEQSQKSMDLQLKHPTHFRTLRYTEVKRIYSYHNVHRGALKSIIGKALEVHPKVAPETSLEGIIYIGSPESFRTQSPDEYHPASLEDFDKAAVDSYRYLKDKLSRDEVRVERIYIVDIRLQLFYQFSISNDEVVTTRGTYGLHTIFPYLKGPLDHIASPPPP